MSKSLMSPDEYEKLKEQCHSGDWSDGGHWQGTGPEPDCWKKESVSSSIRTVISFPTEESAKNWNENQERNIRAAGYVVSTCISAATAILTSGTAGVVIGSIATIVQGELQSQVKYPKVQQGWLVDVKLIHTYSQKVHPWLPPSSFSQERIVKVYDEGMNSQFESSSVQEWDMNDFPESVARKLASAESKSFRISNK